MKLLLDTHVWSWCQARPGRLNHKSRRLIEKNQSELWLSAVSVWEFTDLTQKFLNQPWFLNQVVEAETALFPRQLLLRLKKIENAMGRKPGVRNGPRVIDLDILLYGDAVVTTEDLQIPHARLHERRFVLEPLNELAAELRHPVTHELVRGLLSRVMGQAVRAYRI